MGRSNRSRAERSNALALMASYVVIAAGLSGALVIGSLGAPDPKVAVMAAVGVFGAIALLPVVAMLKRDRADERLYAKREPLWRRMRRWFRREEVRPIRPWKRRRTPPMNAPGGVFRPAAGVGSDVA